MTVCVECEAVTNPGVHLCANCLVGFLEVLRGVPDLITELDSAMTVLKAPARGSGGGGGAPGSKAPGDFQAMCCKNALEGLLTRICVESGLDAPLVPDSVGYVEAIIAGISNVTGSTMVEFYAIELRNESRTAEHVLAGANHRAILGVCETIGCGTTLTVPDHQVAEPHATVTCPTCTCQYTIRLFLQHRAMEALQHDGTPLRPAQAVRHLNAAGVPVTTTDIKNWVRWGSLTPAHINNGVRLYNLADIYRQAIKTGKAA